MVLPPLPHLWSQQGPCWTPGGQGSSLLGFPSLGCIPRLAELCYPLWNSQGELSASPFPAPPEECPAKPSFSGHSENPAQAKSLPGQTRQPDVDPRDSRGWPEGSSLGHPSAAPQALWNVDPKGSFPVFVFISFYPHSRSESRGTRYSSPLCFSQGSRSVGEPCSLFQQKGIPAEPPNPFQKKSKNKDETEGRKSPSLMDGGKKGNKSKASPQCPRAGRRCPDPGVCGGGKSPVLLLVPWAAHPVLSRALPGTAALASAPWHRLRVPSLPPAERPAVLGVTSVLLGVTSVLLGVSSVVLGVTTVLLSVTLALLGVTSELLGVTSAELSVTSALPRAPRAPHAKDAFPPSAAAGFAL